MFKSKALAAEYLSGIIDGEGSISSRRVKKSTSGAVREVRITNTDPELLDAVREGLDMLGVVHATYDRSERERLGSKPIFDIVVSRKANLELLASQITLRSYKARQLREMLGAYVRPGVPPEAQLRIWVEAGQSDKTIAKHKGVTPGAVWAWRKKYGIERIRPEAPVASEA